MTIELVTGAPGAGKTCYAVSQRVVPQSGVTVKAEDGQEYKRRIVVAGIKGLTVDHERIPHVLTGDKVSEAELKRWNALDEDGEPVHKRLPGDPPRTDVEANLYNWWLWCCPGDLIVIDEVQFLIERATLNKAPAYFLRALSIHRHYGVDFLFITQAPEFLDPHVRKLVNPHRHVRSVMGSPLCMLYTWDHASNTERISTSVKGKYLRRPAHYALYKSSVAHVKPPVAGRSGLVVVGLLACAVAVGGYLFSQKFTTANGSQAVASASSSASAAAARRRPPGAPGSDDYGTVTVHRTSDGARIVGCLAWGSSCECRDARGLRVPLTPEQCELSAAGFAGLVGWAPRAAVAPLPPASAPPGRPPGLPPLSGPPSVPSALPVKY